MKRITIDPITRLEGHGKIEIFLNEAGDVANTYFQIPELRGFEKFSDRLHQPYTKPGSGFHGLWYLGYTRGSGRTCSVSQRIAYPGHCGGSHPKLCTHPGIPVHGGCQF